MSEQFRREVRYVVIKIKTGKQVDCVVVEHDWPEYEIVWKMIQDRMEGKPNELPALIEQAKAEETERLIFVLDNDAFIARHHSASGLTYQLWTQDMDENYHVLHDKKEFFKTPIEAVDAAILARKP